MQQKFCYRTEFPDQKSERIKQTDIIELKISTQNDPKSILKDFPAIKLINC